MLPFVKEAAPILENKVRPFAREAQPFQSNLGAASKDLAQAGPDLTGAFLGLNRLLNIGAYNPGGTEGISEGCEKNGACTRDERARNESYLYWLAWVRPEHCFALSTADALGPIRRAYLLNLNCDVFTAGAEQVGVPGTQRRRALPTSTAGWGLREPMIKQTPSIGRIIAMVAFTLSVFAILIFLWLAFGGSVPLRPEATASPCTWRRPRRWRRRPTFAWRA